MMKNPCLDCADRHVGCHITCERHIAWKEEYQAKHSEITKKKTNEMLTTSYQRDAKSRFRKGLPKKFR